jgi:hypothetical protein
VPGIELVKLEINIGVTRKGMTVKIVTGLQRGVLIFLLAYGLYLLGFAPFWEGFLFFCASEFIRTFIIHMVNANYPGWKLIPVATEIAGILFAPFITFLLMLLITPEDKVVNLCSVFTLYASYIPVSMASFFISPLITKAVLKFEGRD